MKELFLKHLFDNYCIKVGCPTDKDGAVKHLIYSIVAPKTGGKGRGEMNDDVFVKMFLDELNIDYSSDIMPLVIEACNEFTFYLTKHD